MTLLNQKAHKFLRNGIIVVVACIVLNPLMPGVIFIGLPLLLIVGFFLFSKWSQEYATLYQEEVIRAVMEEVFDQVDYYPAYGLSNETVHGTNLVSAGNRFYSNDYVNAVYKGITLQMSDVKIQNVQRSGKHTTVITYFSGQWIVLEPQKEINGKLYIIDGDFRYSRPRGFFKDRNLQKVEMEGVAFNREFSILAHDPHEAFYVVTPKLMERFMSIHTENVSVYQDPQSLHIAIDSRIDIMKPNLLSRLELNAEKEKVRQQLQTVLKYIDLVV